MTALAAKAGPGVEMAVPNRRVPMPSSPAGLAELPESRASGRCLRAFLDAVHWGGTVRQMCDALPHGNHEIDIVGLLNTLAALGYAAQPIRLRLDRIDPRLLPCLFVPEARTKNRQAPLVVLRPESGTEGTGRTIYCPEQDKILSPDDVTAPRGTAYFFTRRRDDAFPADPHATAEAPWFSALLRRFRSLFTEIFAASMAINIIGLAAPLFIVAIYDKVIAAHSQAFLYHLIVGVALAVATESVLRLLRLRAICWLGARIDSIVSNAIFTHLLYLPASFTERSSTAAQLARIRSFDSLRDFFSGPLFLVTLEMPFVVVWLAAIAVLAGPLAFIPTLAGGGYLIALVTLRPGLRDAIRTAARSSSDKVRLSLEAFSKIASLRQDGMLEAWSQRLREHSARASFASFRSSFTAAKIEVVAHVLTLLTAVATLGFGVERIWAGHMTVGALIATMILVWRVLSPLNAACSGLPRLEQLANSVQQINRLMGLTPERVPHAAPPAMARPEGRITFSNVGLRYSRDVDPVFAGLSFDVRPGELIAIVGGDGCGKSTVLKLVNRLYSPQAGSIRIGGVDIRQADPIELRRHIAYVPQDPDLFDGTIADNLRLADPTASDDGLRQALARAGALAEVEALPDGMASVVRARSGVTISSDLAYQICLARAYLVDTPIVLLDQPPFSLLNSKGGAAYRDFITGSKGVRTVLFVTHRADYARMADRAIGMRRDERPLVGAPEDVLKRYMA